MDDAITSPPILDCDPELQEQLTQQQDPILLRLRGLELLAQHFQQMLNQLEQDIQDTKKQIYNK